MTTNLTLQQWGAIVFFVYLVIPTGISYRELQGVAFYDLSFPLKFDKDKGGIAREYNFLHWVFFSGGWSSITCLAMSIGWFFYAFYQPDSDIRDTIMALMTLFFALMVGLPYAFIMTDPGYYTKTEIMLAELRMSDEERERLLNITTPTIDEEEEEQAPTPEELAIRKKKMIFSSSWWLMVFYGVVLTLSATAVTVLLIFVENISGWEKTLSICMYAVCIFMSLVVLYMFATMRNPSKRVKSTKTKK